MPSPRLSLENILYRWPDAKGVAMPRGLRHFLLALLFLLAQAGALAHGYTHFPEQTTGDEPVCEQCLAYAPMGAGVSGTPPTWSAPTQTIAFDIAVPAASPAVFRALYQSRAPPRLHR